MTLAAGIWGAGVRKVSQNISLIENRGTMLRHAARRFVSEDTGYQELSFFSISASLVSIDVTLARITWRRSSLSADSGAALSLLLLSGVSSAEAVNVITLRRASLL